MEIITQGLLGAAVAQAGAGRLGRRRALLWGALVGVLPDLDIFLAPLKDGYGDMLFHRGSSHALWFGWVVGPPLGWALWRWRTPAAPHLLRSWQWLCVLALATHPLLDVFTPYGTQLFAPFWRQRFALHGTAIVDPFYTLLLGIPLALGALAAARQVRRRAAWLGLGLGAAYLLAGVGLNLWAQRDLRAALATPQAQVRMYPSMLQPLLRRGVVRDGARVYVGWHTPLRPGCAAGRWFREAPATPELQNLRGTWQVAMFDWFTLGEVTHSSTPLAGGGVRIELSDLRYGGLHGPPERGLWGLRADYDANGRRGPIQRFERREDAQLGSVGDLFRAALGDLSVIPGEMPPDCRGGAQAMTPSARRASWAAES